MGESLPPGGHQYPDDAEPRVEKEAPERLWSLITGLKFRFGIIVIVALLWLFAECTHRSKHARASEPFPEFNATTLSNIADPAMVSTPLDSRQNVPQ
jgi:hypothetical protein